MPIFVRKAPNQLFPIVAKRWESVLLHTNVHRLSYTVNRLGSRFRVNETSQIAGCYSVQMKAAMKQKRLLMLGQMYLLMIECPKHDWHSAFGDKRLWYSRATAGTFILNLLYCAKYRFMIIYVCYLLFSWQYHWKSGKFWSQRRWKFCSMKIIGPIYRV